MSEIPTPEPTVTTDNMTKLEGVGHDDPVPEPPLGVRGADQADRMDNAPGEGTTSGADGETAAREQLRVDLGERPADADREGGDDLEQAAAIGETDDPSSASIGEGR